MERLWETACNWTCVRRRDWRHANVNFYQRVAVKSVTSHRAQNTTVLTSRQTISLPSSCSTEAAKRRTTDRPPSTVLPGSRLAMVFITYFIHEYHIITFHVIKRFGLVYPTAGVAGKYKEWRDVGKAKVSTTKLAWTDLESNTGLRGEKWSLPICTTARP